MSTVSCTVSLLIEIPSVEVKSVIWHPYLDLWNFVYSLGLLVIDEMDPVLSALHLTLRLLMSYIYIYMEHLFLMFLDHTQRPSTIGRTPLDE